MIPKCIHSKHFPITHWRIRCRYLSFSWWLFLVHNIVSFMKCFVFSIHLSCSSTLSNYLFNTSDFIVPHRQIWAIPIEFPYSIFACLIFHLEFSFFRVVWLIFLLFGGTSNQPGNDPKSKWIHCNFLLIIDNRCLFVHFIIGLFPFVCLLQTKHTHS